MPALRQVEPQQPPPDRLRVSLIGSLPPSKGVSAYTSHLLEALAACPELDIDVHTFRRMYPARAYPGGDPDEREERPDRGPGDGDDSRGPLRSAARDGVALRRDLTWYNPLGWALTGLRFRGDVVHAQWWSYALAPVYLTALAVARLRRKRVVMTVHNVAPHEDGFVKRALNRAVLGLAARYIVHSESNRAALRELVGARPIDVVPHGVLETPRTGISRAEARERLGLAADARAVLCFGHIRKYKGVDVLLRAFNDVGRERPNARIVIAGQPWVDWAPYDALIDELGIRDQVVIHLGYVPADAVEAYFVAADVVALPYTRFDAQSGAGARALPFGRPLVVTATGGLPELVLDAEAVVPPGDAPALARAISRVLDDATVADRMSVDSLTLAASLGWERIAARTAEVYAETAGRRATVRDEQAVAPAGAPR